MKRSPRKPTAARIDMEPDPLAGGLRVLVLTERKALHRGRLATLELNETRDDLRRRFIEADRDTHIRKGKGRKRDYGYVRFTGFFRKGDIVEAYCHWLAAPGEGHEGTRNGGLHLRVLVVDDRGNYRHLNRDECISLLQRRAG